MALFGQKTKNNTMLVIAKMCGYVRLRTLKDAQWAKVMG